MTMCLLIALLSANFAQSATESGDARATYVITLRNNKEWALFWEDRKELGEGVYSVEVDSPWDPKTVTVRDSEVTDERRERPSRRKSRIEEELRKLGITEVSPGYYVSTDEARLAQRAREMAGVNDTSEASPAPLAAPAETSVPASLPKETGAPQTREPVATWAPHAAVVIAALVLIALVVKFVLLGGKG